MNVTVCVEGGGDASTLKRQCRKGFSDFFRNAGLSGRMPRIIAGGARENTYKDFRTALTKATDHDFVVLLVDSEGPTSEGIGVWSYLKSRDRWEPPEGVADDNAHLMVQCMEAWFLADRETLARFFGTGFHASALPGRIDIENVPKKRLVDAIENATRQCRPKGRYDKGGLQEIGWIGGSAVDTGGVEIKTAEVKVDGVAEALAVTKAAR